MHVQFRHCKYIAGHVYFYVLFTFVFRVGDLAVDEPGTRPLYQLGTTRAHLIYCLLIYYLRFCLQAWWVCLSIYVSCGWFGLFLVYENHTKNLDRTDKGDDIYVQAGGHLPGPRWWLLGGPTSCLWLSQIKHPESRGRFWTDDVCTHSDSIHFLDFRCFSLVLGLQQFDILKRFTLELSMVD